MRTLLGAGWRVRALVRAEAPALTGLDLTRIAGDLFLPSLADAMTGCDAVFHIAAHYSLWRRDRADVLRTNVEGTRAVLAAAWAAGVPRIVHTSSVAAIGVRHDGAPADESHQSPLAELIGTYKRSKFLAERAARLAFERGQDVVIVSPTTPVGPWDTRPTPTGEMIVRFLTGRMPAYVDTGLNLVDVRDVAAAHLAAYERGRAGERYIAGSENLSLRELLERLGALTGRPAPALRLPRALPLAYAALGELVLARAGVRPDVPLDAVRMAKERMFYSNAKAIGELGMSFGSVTTALADAVSWFRDHGDTSAARFRGMNGARS